MKFINQKITFFIYYAEDQPIDSLIGTSNVEAIYSISSDGESYTSWIPNNIFNSLPKLENKKGYILFSKNNSVIDGYVLYDDLENPEYDCFLNVTQSRQLSIYINESLNINDNFAPLNNVIFTSSNDGNSYISWSKNNTFNSLDNLNDTIVYLFITDNYPYQLYDNCEEPTGPEILCYSDDYIFDLNNCLIPTPTPTPTQTITPTDDDSEIDDSVDSSENYESESPDSDSFIDSESDSNIDINNQYYCVRLKTTDSDSSSINTFQLFDKSSWVDVVPQPYLNYLNLSADRWSQFIQYNKDYYEQIQQLISNADGLPEEWNNTWNGLRLNSSINFQLYNDPTDSSVASCGVFYFAPINFSVKMYPLSFVLNINDYYRNSFSFLDWVNILTHELGHALGIGIFWNPAYQDFGAVPPVDNFLNGLVYNNSQLGYNNITNNLSFNKVPLENSGGPGTISSHWENDFRSSSAPGSEGKDYPGLQNELMIGVVNPISNGGMIISELSIKTLVDFGFEEIIPGNSEDVPILNNSQSLGIQNSLFKLNCNCKSNNTMRALGSLFSVDNNINDLNIEKDSDIDNVEESNSNSDSNDNSGSSDSDSFYISESESSEDDCDTFCIHQSLYNSIIHEIINTYSSIEECSNNCNCESESESESESDKCDSDLCEDCAAACLEEPVWNLDNCVDGDVSIVYIADKTKLPEPLPEPAIPSYDYDDSEAPGKLKFPKKLKIIYSSLNTNCSLPSEMYRTYTFTYSEEASEPSALLVWVGDSEACEASAIVWTDNKFTISLTFNKTVIVYQFFAPVRWRSFYDDWILNDFTTFSNAENFEEIPEPRITGSYANFFCENECFNIGCVECQQIVSWRIIDSQSFVYASGPVDDGYSLRWLPTTIDPLFYSISGPQTWKLQVRSCEEEDWDTIESFDIDIGICNGEDRYPLYELNGPWPLPPSLITDENADCPEIQPGQPGTVVNWANAGGQAVTFTAAYDNEWTNYLNWQDAAGKTPVSSLPDSASNIVISGDVLSSADNLVSVNSLTISAGASFNIAASVNTLLVSGAVSNNSICEDVFGEITVSGSAIFENSGTLSGKIIGDATFTDNSSILSGGEVTGTATFVDNSCISSGAIVGSSIPENPRICDLYDDSIDSDSQIDS